MTGSDSLDLDAGVGDHPDELDRIGEPAVEPVGMAADTGRLANLVQ